MAVTSNIYVDAITGIADGSIDIESATLKIVLLDSGAAFDSADSVYSDITGDEVTGTGYTAGGKTLTGIDVSESAGVVTIAANSATWTASTISAYAAAIYVDGVTDTLVAYIDFSEEIATSTEDFVVSFPDGILTFEAVAA